MAVEGNRVEASVWRGMVKLRAHAVRRGDGGGSGGARLEIAGERRRWGSAVEEVGGESGDVGRLGRPWRLQPASQR
uniref:Uncharacterized protein n=1 Tax=Oryza sativa subsp. japonica TaxID=39947 RepID=Q6YZF4_ORYSJ|nr:hypothetical protein [Oryza sativa Japonica Group]BAD13167.1 hypothetical protein [Oryza sativa Japonica Group]